MKPNKITAHESFLVATGSGDFPFDMLRYDTCFPFRSEDATAMANASQTINLLLLPTHRRVVLVRRSVTQLPATSRRWHSFGWTVQEFKNSADAVEYAKVP